MEKPRKINSWPDFRVVLTLASALVPLTAPRCTAQSLPFEDKAKYEKTLEQKADDVLVRLLGPNQAKVILETVMDFSRTEKVEVSSQLEQDKGNPFKWQAAGGDAQSGDYLMPGFPSFAAGGTENKSYNRQMLYPSAFVKRMNVSIIVNRDVPELDAENIRRVVSEVLMLDPKRGDQLSVIKAPFAPLWRTIWYTPEAISMVLKYVLLAVMGIIGMIVVAVGFLKLAGAMSTMAKVQQSHQITMDLGKGAAPGGIEASAAGASPDKPQLTGPGKEEPEESGRVLFDIRPSQVPFLVNMMVTEDPANVALVAAHLAQEVRAEFLKALPPEFSSDVVINMAKIRFVEPEIIGTLKEELERRLSGAVGGLDGAMEAISAIDLRAKKGMLEELRKKHPELAAEVRRRLLMPEDLAFLDEKGLSLMATTVKPEEWATALFELPDEVRQKIKAQMADKTWQMIEQSMSYGVPSREKVEEALERILATAAALIRDGRIADPAAAAGTMIANEQAGA